MPSTSVATESERRYEKVSLEPVAIEQLREVSYELTGRENRRVTLSKAILYLIDFYRQHGIERDEFTEVLEALNHKSTGTDARSG